MITHWGDIEVSDAHVHLFSHRFFSMLAAQRRSSLAEAGALLGWEMPPESAADLAAIWKAELDRHGVASSVMIGSLPGEEVSVIEAVTAEPARLTGFFMVNPLAADALDRTRNALAAGLRGVCLFPAMHGYPLAHDRVNEIAAITASHPGTLMFVHCGVLSVGVRRKLGLPSPFDMRFSNPLDVHALALRYPGLPWVIPHFGAGMFREALMVADLCPNVYLDTSSSNSWMKYQEPGCDLLSVFRRAFAITGPGRLLFGTDSSFFPRGWHRAIFDQQCNVLRELAVSAEDAGAILGGNLRRITSRAEADRAAG